MTGVAAELQRCGFASAYRVTRAPSDACADYPRLAERVVFASAADGTASVTLGALTLPLERGANACTFVAAGCKDVSGDASSAARYLAPKVELSLAAGTLQLAASATDVAAGSVGPCGAAAFEATPIAACDPVGTTTAPADAVASGCALVWPAGSVTVSADVDGTYTIDWAGTHVPDAKLDPASCTLSADRGVGTNLWIYNGVQRHLHLALTVTEHGLDGTAQDALDGSTVDGKTCGVGTFTLHSETAARAATTFASSCTNPAPAACGDGVCSAGESCQCQADCGCSAGAVCASDGACRVPCHLASEDADCGANERCSPFGWNGEAARVIFPTDATYCAAAGTLAAHEVCTSTAACAAGLICHVAMRGRVARCTPPCGDGFPACAEGESCGQAGDGSGSGSYPEAVAGCERPGGFGADCASDPCAPSLSCITVGSGAAAKSYCSHTCSQASDCGAPLASCHPLAQYCVPN